MSITKRNHFVDQHYLSAWGNNTKIVWVYDKETSKYFPNNVINCGVKNKLYTQEIENYRTHSIESRVCTLIDEIRKSDKIITMLTKDEAISVLRYLIVGLRGLHPIFLNKLGDMFNELRDEITTKFIVNDAPNIIDPFSNKLAGLSNQQLYNIISGKGALAILNKLIAQYNPYEEAKGNLEQLVNHLADVLCIQLFTIERNDCPLITSDNPVYITGNMLGEYINSVLYFPLSPTKLIVAYHNHAKEPVITNDITLGHNGINAALYGESLRHIYAADKSTLEFTVMQDTTSLSLTPSTFVLDHENRKHNFNAGHGF